ncbi:unnamed protein product, partial [Iphiclides podalirius]
MIVPIVTSSLYSDESKINNSNYGCCLLKRVQRVKPAPGSPYCLEERVIHVSGRNEAEHEQAQHNHYLLLHRGETRKKKLVVGQWRRASGRVRRVAGSPAGRVSFTFGRWALRYFAWCPSQPVNWLDT